MNFVYNFNIFKGICFIVFFFFISETIFAQETKARVTVTATANDNIEAKNLALRSAIEQAFGAYISSNTEILNDELIKDEVISISSGNIDSIHVICETKLVDGRTSVSLLAVVSVNKLVTYCESKGYKVEFNGGMFSANLKQQKLNESAELIALENVCDVGKSLINRSFDYNLTVSQPQQDNISGTEMWNLVYDVKVKPNNNFEEFKSYILGNISKISMKADEVDNYVGLNKKVYKIEWKDPSQNVDTSYYFRNFHSLAIIQDLFWHAKFSLGFFRIASNVDTIDIYNVNMFPNKPKFSSNLSESQFVDEFLSLSFSPPLIRRDLVDDNGRRTVSYVNYGIGKIYEVRSEFFRNQTLRLEQLNKDMVTSQESLKPYFVSNIQKTQKSLSYFYRDKYIFVGHVGNGSEGFETLRNGVNYDAIKINIKIDSQYLGQFVFTRAFNLIELEKIKSVEVFPAGRTLGL